jgi:poly-gamma-glutamate synthesis protein (capsule biosynthesis protein)
MIGKTAAMAALIILTFTFGCARSPGAPIAKKDLPPLKKTVFVDLQQYIPSLVIDLVYYTEKNFTGQKLYDSPVAYLRKGTADKLKKASDEVALKGYRLKIWDAYRPPEVQFKMWKVYPDPNFVASPYRGSDHSRGCAVDLTLVDAGGRELEMPSPFDEFSPRADRDYSDVSPEKKYNSIYLESVMTKNGFITNRKEWWHFADSERKQYGIVEKPVLPR